MSGSGGFQQFVASQPAVGVAGDRASKNPIWSYDVGAGGLVAGSAGVFIGRFAWVVPPLDSNGTPTIANSFGSGAPAGFVSRHLQGSNSTYLSFAGMRILPGYEMAIQTAGDFFAVNAGSTAATRGMKAYASFSDGTVSFAASGSPTAGASATGSTIAATTFSVTGSIAGDILTVTAVGSGTVYPGSTISGTNVSSGTMILSQISGTAGGAGTYYVSIPEQTAASTTISGTYGLMTIGTLTTTQVFAVGQTLSTTGSVAAGTQITANVTGTGGTGGTMVVNNNTAVGTPQVISTVSNVETAFYCLSAGLTGETVKIGTTPSYGANQS